MSKLLFFLFLTIISCFDVKPIEAANRWIAPSGGLTTGDCLTSATACTRDRAYAVGVNGAAEELIFKPGIYPNWVEFQIQKGGNSNTSRWVLRSQFRRQAIIQPVASAGAFRVERSFTTIRGFRVEGHGSGVTGGTCMGIGGTPAKQYITFEDNQCYKMGAMGIYAGGGVAQTDFKFRYNNVNGTGYNTSLPTSEVFYVGTNSSVAGIKTERFEYYGNLLQDCTSQVWDLKDTAYDINVHHNIVEGCTTNGPGRITNDSSVGLVANVRNLQPNPTLNKVQDNIFRDLIGYDTPGKLLYNDHNASIAFNRNVFYDTAPSMPIMYLRSDSSTMDLRNNTGCNTSGTITDEDGGTLEALTSGTSLNLAQSFCNSEVQRIIGGIAVRPVIATAEVGLVAVNKIRIVLTNASRAAIDGAEMVGNTTRIAAVNHALCTLSGMTPARTITASAVVGLNTIDFTLSGNADSDDVPLLSCSAAAFKNTGEIGDAWISDLATSAAITNQPVTNNIKTPVVPPAAPIQFYISTTGSDSNSCAAAQNISTPKLNLIGGSGVLSCLVPARGDIVNIRAGTYSDAITSVVSGTSFDNAATIRAYSGETVTLTGGIALEGPSYVKFQDLKITTNSIWVGSTFGDGSNAGHHIRFTNIDASGAGTSFNIVEFNRWTHHNEWIGGTVHSADQGAYAFYVSGDDNLFDHVTVRDNSAFGFHIFSAYPQLPDRNVVQFSTLYNNGTLKNINTTVTSAILLGSGDNNQAYGNLVYRNGGDGIATSNGATNSKIYNNVVYGNNTTKTSYGGIVWGTGSSTRISNNIAYQNGVGDFVDSHSVQTPTFGNNFCTNAGTGCALSGDPRFANVAANDYRLCTAAGAPYPTCSGLSPALNTGGALGSPYNVDIVGIERPQGSAWDIGAYESIIAPVVPPPSIPPPLPPSTTGKIYYVATNGNDSHTCEQAQNVNTPKATIFVKGNGAGYCVVGGRGDQVQIRGGTYNDGISSGYIGNAWSQSVLPSGTSWGDALTFKPYNNEVVILKPNGLFSGAFTFTVPTKYVIVENLILDGTDCGSACDGVVNGNTTVSYIRFLNVEVRNANCVLVGWGGHYSEFIGGSYHDTVINNCGGKFASGSGYGWYMTGSYNLVERVKCYNIAGYCVHNYLNCGNNPNCVWGSNGNNTYRYMEVFNNALDTSVNFFAGMVLGSGDNIKAHNNVVYGHVNGGGIACGNGATNCKVWNNTIVNNGRDCISWHNSNGGDYRNNICKGNGANLVAYDSSSYTASNNRGDSSGIGISTTADPMFINEGANDFRLQSASPMKNGGIDVSLPCSGACAIGAFDPAEIK